MRSSRRRRQPPAATSTPSTSRRRSQDGVQVVVPAAAPAGVSAAAPAAAHERCDGADAHRSISTPRPPSSSTRSTASARRPRRRSSTTVVSTAAFAASTTSVRFRASARRSWRRCAARSSHDRVPSVRQAAGQRRSRAGRFAIAVGALALRRPGTSLGGGGRRSPAPGSDRRRSSRRARRGLATRLAVTRRGAHARLLLGAPRPSSWARSDRRAGRRARPHGVGALDRPCRNAARDLPRAATASGRSGAKRRSRSFGGAGKRESGCWCGRAARRRDRPGAAVRGGLRALPPYESAARRRGAHALSRPTSSRPPAAVAVALRVCSTASASVPSDELATDCRRPWEPLPVEWCSARARRCRTTSPMTSEPRLDAHRRRERRERRAAASVGARSKPWRWRPLRVRLWPLVGHRRLCAARRRRPVGPASGRDGRGDSSRRSHRRARRGGTRYCSRQPRHWSPIPAWPVEDLGWQLSFAAVVALISLLAGATARLATSCRCSRQSSPR